MVHAIECVSKIQVASKQKLLACSSFLNCPVQALHLSLRAVQPPPPPPAERPPNHHPRHHHRHQCPPPPPPPPPHRISKSGPARPGPARPIRHHSCGLGPTSQSVGRECRLAGRAGGRGSMVEGEVPVRGVKFLTKEGIPHSLLYRVGAGVHYVLGLGGGRGSMRGRVCMPVGCTLQKNLESLNQAKHS